MSGIGAALVGYPATIWRLRDSVREPQIPVLSGADEKTPIKTFLCRSRSLTANGLDGKRKHCPRLRLFRSGYKEAVVARWLKAHVMGLHGVWCPANSNTQ